MKCNGLIGLALIALLAAAPASAKDPIDHGSELFYGTALSVNGKSCSTCHPRGKTLEELPYLKQQHLPMIVNECIRKGLEGFAIPVDSPDMEDLIAYMRNLTEQNLSTRQ